MVETYRSNIGQLSRCWRRRIHTTQDCAARCACDCPHARWWWLAACIVCCFWGLTTNVLAIARLSINVLPSRPEETVPVQSEQQRTTSPVNADPAAGRVMDYPACQAAVRIALKTGDAVQTQLHWRNISCQCTIPEFLVSD